MKRLRTIVLGAAWWLVTLAEDAINAHRRCDYCARKDRRSQE